MQVLSRLEGVFDASADYTIEPLTLREKSVFVSRASARLGVLSSLMACAPLLAGLPTDLTTYMTFLLNKGLADLADDVWESALQAALSGVHLHGGDNLTLDSMFQSATDAPGQHSACGHRSGWPEEGRRTGAG